MHNEYTAIIEQAGERYIGYGPKIPGADGQGRTVEECPTTRSATWWSFSETERIAETLSKTGVFFEEEVQRWRSRG